MEARRFLVEGLVQGVGFRWFVRRQARALDLAGWVRNTPDGAVEVVAAGPVDALDQLRVALDAGPPAARVSRVAAAPGPRTPDLPRPFEIR